MLPPESQLPPPPVAEAEQPEEMEKLQASQRPDEGDFHGSQIELEVTCASSPEAFQLMLDHVYGTGLGFSWEYSPSCAEVNQDVIRLAEAFELHFLREQAVRWLVKDLTTSNVVDRLVTCNEFNLCGLRAEIMRHLIADADKLRMVAEGTEIVKHPQVLQDILLSVATKGEEISRFVPPEDDITGMEQAGRNGVDRESEEKAGSPKRKKVLNRRVIGKKQRVE